MKQKKNSKFDIIVGIPTYNEADSITNTVQKIDDGLVKYFPARRSLIVNVDSRSVDNTRHTFLSAKTKTAKISLVSNKKLRGKGTNIFLLLKISKKFNARYIAMIDADVTTITKKWPKLLLTPLIKEQMDFVAPVYTRNRYEGNTTNHFCFPVLYAWFGQSFGQPIGGDFAMSSYFANYILSQKKPQNSYLYGIDIFLSIHAIGANFKTKEVFLGRKIHKPSFDKIIPMFQQVAAVMIFVLSQYKNRRDILRVDTILKNNKRIDSFIKRPDQNKIISLKKYAFQNLEKLAYEDIYKYLGLDVEKIKLISRSRILISEDDWIKILKSLLNYIAEHSVKNKETEKIAITIAPFFFLRVLSYFKELDENFKTDYADNIIYKQAQEIRKLYTAVKGGTLFIQPHSDDIVMSSYFIIKSGILPKPYYIVTVFSRSNFIVSSKKTILKLHPTVQNITDFRTQEDKKFANIIGADCIFLGFPDCLLRTGKIISKPKVKLDKKLIVSITSAINSIIQNYDIKTTVLHFPYGKKQHYDHRAVKQAVMSIKSINQIYFVDDIPYSRVQNLSEHNLQICNKIRINSLQEKFDAMSVYKSQMHPPFFERIRDFADENNGFERLLKFSKKHNMDK